MKYNPNKVLSEKVDTSGSYDNIKDISVKPVEKDDPLAYVHIHKGKQEIVYWDKLEEVEELRRKVLKHELGHLYYNHLPATPQLTEQVRSYRDDLTTQMVRYILNVCMDYQINSTLLELSDIEELEAWVESTKGKKVQMCHPSRVNYPDGRTTEEYIDRMMLDMEGQDPAEFLGLPQVAIGMPMPGQGQGDPQDGQGDGDPQDGQGEGDGTEQDGKMSGKFGDVDVTITEEKYKELRDQQDKYGTNRGQSRGSQANVYGEIEIAEKLTAVQKLANLIKPYMKRIHRSYRLDMKVCRNIYKNTLRGRTRMYVPSYKTQVARVYEKGAIDFLVDVSGSTDPDVNKKIVRDAFELIATPGKFMDIYMWNTSLVEKVTAKDLAELNIKTFVTGGGTDLADGITHISKQSKDKRPLVIISDLEDNLDDWRSALKKCDYNFSDVLILNHGGEVKEDDFPEVIQLPDEYSM